MKALRWLLLVASVASAQTYYDKTTIAPTGATNTVLGNKTSATAAPTYMAVGTCSTAASALKWTTNTGFGCNTSIDAATLGTATFAAPGAIGGGTASTGAFTTISATGQITSTLAIGTAPLVITSTTNVANLNASSLGGATFAAPGPVGSGTPSTGAFTTLSASSTVSGTGFSTYLASPPAIGGSAPAAGNFTTLGASGLISPTSTVGVKGTTAADEPAAGSVGEIASIHCIVGTSGAAGTNVTLNQGSPGTVTWTSHTFSTSTGLANYTCPINFTTAGSLPTGLVVGVNYYIIGSTLSTDTFQVADTAAHALAGTNAINFTGSPSGQQKAYIGALTGSTAVVAGAGIMLVAGDWDCSSTSEYQADGYELGGLRR